jgi:hypothetical protein
LWCSQVSDDFTLTPISHLSVTVKGCQYFFIPEVLAPGFEFLWGLAGSLAEPGKCFSKTVWVEIRHIGTFKCIAENLEDRNGVAPMFSFQPDRLKLEFCIFSIRVAGNSGSSFSQSYSRLIVFIFSLASIKNIYSAILKRSEA